MNVDIAMAPSPQQAFSGQGVLRISGFCVIEFFLKFMFLLFLCGIVVLLSGDVELNPGPCRPKYCNLLFSNIRGLHGNLNERSYLGKI